MPQPGRPTFPQVLENLLSAIEAAIERGQAYSAIRLGDGEAHFLSGRFQGSVAARDLGGSPLLPELSEWRGFQGNDLMTFDLNPGRRALWVPVLGEQVMERFTPFAPIYAAVANRSLFRRFAGSRIGLIGSGTKLRLIRRLLEHAAYRRYLGVRSFAQYVTFPDRGGCLEPEQTLLSLIQQIDDDPCDIYLVGIGIAKLRLLSRLRDLTGSVVIDVGIGIDALAGVVPFDRGYFGEWRNYRLADVDYRTVDHCLPRTLLSPAEYRATHIELN